MVSPAAQREDRDRRARKVWALLASGKTDEEARAELALKPLEYRIARARMLELEGHRIREKPPEEIFLEYSIIQLGLMAFAPTKKAQPHTFRRSAQSPISTTRS